MRFNHLFIHSFSNNNYKNKFKKTKKEALKTHQILLYFSYLLTKNFYKSVLLLFENQI